MDRHELATYLRRCRERLRPADVGLPAGVRRRTPGLRREEVAQLAGMSVDYYTRLEQGRGPHPSRQVLGSLARALRLDEDQRDHLFHLVGEPSPTPESSTEHVRPAVLHMLDRLDDTPASVGNDRHDVLAWNAMAAAVFGDLSVLPPHQRNISWLHFSDPARRALHPPEELARISLSHVADLRASLARRPDDERLAGLIRELRATSAEFRELWERHDVRVRRSDRKVILHPVVGRLDLDCEVLLMPEHDQRLVVHTARPGTPTHERLQLLRVVGLQFAGTSLGT
jgi:transcriptional regulator with XRE-family HTH domain